METIVAERGEERRGEERRGEERRGEERTAAADAPLKRAVSAAAVAEEIAGAAGAADDAGIEQGRKACESGWLQQQQQQRRVSGEQTARTTVHRLATPPIAERA